MATVSAASGDDPPTLDRQSILTRGWEQGALIAAELLTAPSGPPWDGGIVVTQSCDLLHSSVEAEPFIEVLPYRLRDGKLDSRYERSAHPRVLEFEYSDRTLRIGVHDRQHLDRTILARPDVAPTGSLDSDTLDLVLNWLTLRYLRPALPEELGRRVDQQKVQKAVDGQRRFVHGFFIQVDPLDELGADQPYGVRLLLVARSTARGNKHAERGIRELVNRLISRFINASGVDLPDIDDWPADGSPSATQLDAACSSVLRWDDQFTLAELEYWTQLNPDAISFDAD